MKKMIQFLTVSSKQCIWQKLKTIFVFFKLTIHQYCTNALMFHEDNEQDEKCFECHLSGARTAFLLFNKVMKDTIFQLTVLLLSS